MALTDKVIGKPVELFFYLIYGSCICKYHHALTTTPDSITFMSGKKDTVSFYPNIIDATMLLLFSFCDNRLHDNKCVKYALMY